MSGGHNIHLSHGSTSF